MTSRRRPSTANAKFNLSEQGSNLRLHAHLDALRSERDRLREEAEWQLREAVACSGDVAAFDKAMGLYNETMVRIDAFEREMLRVIERKDNNELRDKYVWRNPFGKARVRKRKSKTSDQ